jgi:ribulose-bisphosphate carboxylase small chain
VRLSFIVNRPGVEPGLRLERSESTGRSIRYTTHVAGAARAPGGGR